MTISESEYNQVIDGLRMQLQLLRKKQDETTSSNRALEAWLNETRSKLFLSENHVSTLAAINLKSSQMLLVELSGLYPTPQEGYGGDLNWALRDVVSALKQWRANSSKRKVKF